MISRIDGAVRPKIVPPLHPEFIPAVLWNRAYRDAAAADGGSVPLAIGLERADGSISRFQTIVFPPEHPLFEAGLRHAQRLVKSLLWMGGGQKVAVGGPHTLGGMLQKDYSRRGER